MRKPDFYRYFLAFRPDLVLRCWLASVRDAAGQYEKTVKAELLHLTLCVIAETRDRDPFVVPRVRAALDHRLLSSFSLFLGQVRSGAAGASVRTTGRQYDIQDFYRMLVTWLAEREIFPRHRRSGLRPHVTLGYDPCAFAPFRVTQEWIPNELLLIESEVGHGVHNVLAGWNLLPPTQGSLPFGAPPAALLPPTPSPPAMATGGWRHGSAG